MMIVQMVDRNNFQKYCKKQFLQFDGIIIVDSQKMQLDNKLVAYNGYNQLYTIHIIYKQQNNNRTMVSQNKNANIKIKSIFIHLSFFYLHPSQLFHNYFIEIMFEVKMEPESQGLIKTIKLAMMKCASNNEISKFCCNENCRFDVFCCREESCKTCGEAHQDCSFRQLSQLLKRIQNKLALEKTVLLEMFKLEEILMEKIIQARYELSEQNYLKSKRGKFHHFISKFHQNAPINITGTEINSWFHTLSIAKIQDSSKKAILKYKQKAEALVNELISTRQLIFQQFFQQEMVDHKHEIEEPQKIININEHSSHHSKETSLIDSLILQKDEEAQEKIDYLLKEIGQPVQFKLLFRASEHNFGSKKFHEICDGVTKTLTIIKTQFNKTIAGFTQLQWDHSRSFARDDLDSSFLLHLDLKQKMTLRTKTKAIYNNIINGPSFGSDLVISNKCHQNIDSNCNFPYSYNYAHEYKRDSKKSRKIFCGSQNGHFKVIQYEVFRVIK